LKGGDIREAHENFERAPKEEVQEAFTLAVNSALLKGYTPGAPGYQRGHSILFDGVASNPQSLFYNSITPEFERRLHNGRFWENLARLDSSLNGGNAYNLVEDVLVHHYNDLDMGFLPNGIAIFNRNLQDAGMRNDFTLAGTNNRFGAVEGLSLRAIMQYERLLTKISAHVPKPISKKDYKTLVKPYIDALELRDEDGYFFPELRRGSQKFRSLLKTRFEIDSSKTF
jgi:hypothetical protein